MNDFEFLCKGVLAGLAISAPVGPVNVLCISRTIVKGPRAGLISGLGAASSDTLYGAIAGFSIQFVIQFLLREEFWIRLIGGILLILIGVVYYVKRPPSIGKDYGEKQAGSEYFSAFILTLTNPTVVLSFLAVLAGLGLGHDRIHSSTLVLIAGIFAGAMLWWTVLALTANHFRERLDDRAMVWMNRIAGLAIGGFGILNVILSRWHSH